MLMAQSASTVKKTSMELGGNAPFIVFDDADLDAAVRGCDRLEISQCRADPVSASIASLFRNPFTDAFVERLSKAVAALKVGDGFATDTDYRSAYQ